MCYLLTARRELHKVVTCLECKEVKHLLCREDYKLWIEQPESTQRPPGRCSGHQIICVMRTGLSEKPNVSQDHFIPVLPLSPYVANLAQCVYKLVQKDFGDNDKKVLFMFIQPFL